MKSWDENQKKDAKAAAKYDEMDADAQAKWDEEYAAKVAKEDEFIAEMKKLAKFDDDTCKEKC